MQMTAHGAQAPAWPLPTPLTHHQEAPFETRCQEPSEGARGTNAALFSIDALAGRPQAPAAATQGGSQPGTVGARPPPAPLPPQDVQQPPAAGPQSAQAKPVTSHPVPQLSSPNSVLAFLRPGGGASAGGAAGEGSAATTLDGTTVAAAGANALTSSPAVAQQAMMQASAAYKRRDYASAVQLCRALYSAGHARRTDLLLLLGAAHYQLGQYRECVAANDQAILLDPSLAEAHANLANALQQLGAVDLALMYYSSALRLKPAFTDALNNMATAHLQKGAVAQAMEAYQAALAISPGLPDVRTNLGALALGNLAGMFYDQGKLEQAIGTYQRAIAAQPQFPEAYNNLGNALREAGRPEDAIAAYTTCIQLQLAAAQAPLLAGQVNFSGPAAQNLASQQAQRLSVAYNNLAGILKMTSRLAECIQCYEHVVFLQPHSPEAYANLASALKDCGRHDEALVAYRQALHLRPDFPEAFANYVHSLQCVCEWRDRPALFARLEQEVRRDVAAGRLPPVQPFHAMAYPFPADLALAIGAQYAQYCLSVAQRLGVPRLPHPPSAPLAPGQRLRVGYVSSDFGNHPLSHLMGAVFGMHDRSKVEVFCYALTPSDGSQWRARIEAEAEHFLDVSSWGAAQTARRMSDDGIQIAVNLNGYTKGARNEIFALQPAPVQASYLGFPATTGAPFLPWLILDKVVCPPSSRHCYSESIAFMPNSYFANDYKQAHREVLDEGNLPSRAEIGLPEGKVIYSCANQLYKYDPETFTTWCNILRRVPDSVLWLLRFPPYGEARIKSEAAARGVDPDRVIFTDVAAKPMHIRRSGVADLFLDTPLCNAHTTGCDVLWGGCPMVTLPLERFASRVAASLCAATGLGEEMVVRSQQEYEDRAVELGLDHARRASLRARLQSARLTCPLFDTAGWVRDFERTLLRMWEIHCEGGGPRDFETPPAAPAAPAKPTAAPGVELKTEPAD